MKITPPRLLKRPIVVAAFEGWNDAGEAASTALNRLADACDAVPVGEIDPEEYYDFQVNRPMLVLDDSGARRIEWPTTRVLVGSLTAEGPDLVLVKGIEPSVRWRAFTSEIVDLCQDVNASLVVLLGALLADTPHGRPVPVTGVGSSAELTDRLGLRSASYTGPTGIVGVVAEAVTAVEVPVVSFWASVPYYVGQPPSPKAVLALLGHVEKVLGVTLDVGDLATEAAAWEQAVDEMVAEDEELSGIVEQLEENADDESMQATSGEAIAAEFERYLRGRRPDH